MGKRIGLSFILLSVLSACGGGNDSQPTLAAQLGYSAANPVTANNQWIPVIQEFDGVEMALVPAGCFRMGSNEGDSDEQPVHEICFDTPFWIDRYEVTNERYGSTGCEDESSQPDQPRNCVNWLAAHDFCARRGARLPTEAEWEYAARGPDGLIFPWGNDFVADNLVFRGNVGRRTLPVGSSPGGVSWVGTYDLSGNVWEWTGTLYRDYPYSATDGREDTSDTDSARVLRGGSFHDSEFNLRAADRGDANPANGFDRLGFRCARSYTGNPSTDSPTTTSAQLGYSVENPVTANNQWTPVVREFDGVETVLVPAGCFLMGSAAEEIAELISAHHHDWFANQGPQIEICFDAPFWMDRYEVTNGQFEQWGGVAIYDSDWAGDSRPRTRIFWAEARDFCKRRGARLPTEAEWEYAARGPDALIFPWGNDFVADNVTYYDNSGAQTGAVGVGSRPGGISWVGAYDLSGSVWEWTSTLYQDYPYNVTDGREDDNDTDEDRVLRGGSSINVEYYLRTASRINGDPADDDGGYGFRCARDYAEED